MKDETTSSLKLTLFGSMRIEVNGVSLAGKCARKEQWLLALLALRPGKAVTREYLAGLLWPDTTEEQSLYNLRRALSNLRSALEEAGDCLQVIKPRSLCLDATLVSIDVLEFDRLIASPDPAALEGAIALRNAPLLEDCTEDWAFIERNAREVAYTRVLDRMVENAVSGQVWADAAHYARLLLNADPLEEKACRSLMLALARTNNHGAAMQVFRDLRLRLREDINTEPDPETLALHEALRQEARHIAPTPPTVPPAPPRPPAEKPIRLSLPQNVTRLIGRESEQAEVLSLLSHSRLVTLTGAGGIGKTSLSLEVAHQAEERFAEGVSFVELAPLVDANRLANHVAQSLRIVEESGIAITDTLTTALAGRQMLLILDNCEHLVDACARLTHHLLGHCPRLHILASSRQSLGLTGEIVWRVPSLPTPPEIMAVSAINAAKVDSSTVLEYPSVQLFLERVRQGNPDFRLTPPALPVIAQICRQLDGIPLALELAAGRARVLPLAHIAARLDDRLRLLVGGSRAALPRQQTLRALMDWSYDLLTESERALLRYLSVFTNGWTLEAAQAVASESAEITVPFPDGSFVTVPREGGSIPVASTAALEPIEAWEVLDLLMALAEKSLVIYEESADGPRYRMLETVRHYGHEKLREAGEDPAAHGKHCEYFYRFLMELKKTLAGRDQGKTLNLFDIEKANLTKALDFAGRQEDSRDRALEMASALQPYWRVRGFLSEGRQKLRVLLDSTSAPTLARAIALNAACTLAYFQGDFEEAWNYGEVGLAIQRALNNTNGIGAALGNMANVANYLGKYETARRLNEEALELYRQTNNKLSIAITLNGLGATMLQLGELDQAETYFCSSLVLRRELEDPLGISVTLSNLADIALQKGDIETAEKYVSEGEPLCNAVANRRGQASIQAHRGQIALRNEKYDQAMAHFQEMFRLYRLIEDKTGYFTFLELTIELALERRQFERAARLNGALHAFRDRLQFFRSPVAARVEDAIRQRLEAHLPPETIAALFQEGWALSTEAALEYAANETVQACQSKVGRLSSRG